MRLTLKEWRRAKGISQEEMAEVCGVHLNTYRDWEEHPESIKLVHAVAIANRLGLQLRDIFLIENITKVDKSTDEVVA